MIFHRALPLAFLAAWFAAPARGQSPPEWRLVRWGELKVGSVCVSRSEEKRGAETLLRTDVDREFAYFQGKDVRSVSRETVLERADGSVVEFTYACQAEAGKTVVIGNVSGGKLKYLTQNPGEAPQETECDWPGDALGPAAVERNLKAGASSRGGNVGVLAYSFSAFSLVPTNFVFEGTETIRLGGRERAARRIAVLEGEGAAGRKTRWLGEDGSFLRETDAWSRMEEACAEEQARAPGKGAVARYAWTNAPVSGAVIRPRAAAGATFVLSGHPVLGEWPFAGPGQAFARQGGNVTITVRIPSRPASPARIPVASKEMEAFLAPNYFLDCDQEAVRELAGRIVGGEKDAGKAAEAIRAWALRNLAKKPLNTWMAAASAAIALGEGDAVEHAVVVAALCRAAGIPSRIAGGFLMTSAYAACHVWAEAWTGAWVPLDATQEKPTDAMRIRFAEWDLNSGTPEEVLVGIAGMAKDLRIEIQAYQVGTFLVDPRDPNKGAQRTEGDTYFHALYQFGFTKPREFRWMTEMRGLDNALVATCGKGGNQERILIRIGPSSGYTLDTALAAMGKNFNVQVVSRLEVGGCPAVIARTGAGFAPLICMILAGDVILTVESSDSTPEVKAGFELVLKTMQFKE